MEPTITTSPQPNPQPKTATKKWLVIGAAIVVVAAIVAVAIWYLNRGQEPQTADLNTALPVADISINPNGYSPSTITVKRGQQVTWTNNDTKPHNIAADQDATPSLGTSETLNRSDSYTYAFDTAGTYHYYDPQNNSAYVGTIIIEQ